LVGTVVQSNTHLAIDPDLVGVPVALAPGKAVVKLVTRSVMAADAIGLVHGGFTFGLADYAAMLAVNDPNVVLGAAEVKLLAPVRVGDELVASAEVIEEKGKKRSVSCKVMVRDITVMECSLTCFVLEKHILA